MRYPSAVHGVEADLLGRAVLLSILIHLLIFILFFSTHDRDPAPVPVFTVEIIPRPFQGDRPQVVSEPQSREVPEPPKQAKLAAEKNRAAEEEQVRKGDGLDAAPVTGSKSGSESEGVQARKEAAPSAPSQDPPPLSLKLSNRELLQEFARNAPKPEDRLEQLVKPEQSQDYRPFSRPRGSGAKFLGQTGTTDHLPHLPDGDITLLNTKAAKFAVFVRRVATQVFSQLRASGWEQIRAGDIHAIRNYTTVRATLDPSGSLITIALESPSGSVRFDEVVKQSVRAGAKDPHPPEEALAADGKYHFVFRARSWSTVAPSAGGKGVSERRWLLLGTGLL